MLAAWRNERGVVLVLVLVVMVVLLGMGLTSLFSAYTNLLVSTNLRLSTNARDRADTAVNEALYRLSRQEGQPGAITPDLSDPNWQVEIDFTSDDSNTADGTVSTIQAGGDWPDSDVTPSHPVTIRFRKADPTGNPNRVLFYNRTVTPPFQEYDLPSTSIPADARPVLQIVSTGLDNRDAERQLIADVTSTVSFAPPAPLSSGVDVNLNGTGFIDGVNHDHRIYITEGTGVNAMYGDNNDETTDTPITATSPIKDSPDDNVGATNTTFFNVTVQAYPAGGNGNGNGSSSSGGSSTSSSSSGGSSTSSSSSGGSSGGGSVPQCESGVANPNLNVPLSQIPPATQTSAYRACARQFDKQISATDTTPAWVGLQWISNPTASGCTVAPYNHSANPHWHGTNTGYASAIALSATPVVLQDKKPNTTVWNRGVFTWRNNNEADTTNFPGSTDPIATTPAANTTSNCSPTGVPSLICRPQVLAHGPDSFSSSSHFPYFQEFLGLDDVSFQKLLDKPDSCGGAQASCSRVIGSSTAPLGFTYIKMTSLSDYFHMTNVASPGTNDFGLIYVNGSLRIASNFTFKGFIFVDGSLDITGEPTILGAIMVRGATNLTAGTGNMTLLYSRKAAERGIQAGHPWRILSWEDSAIQETVYSE